MPIIKDLKNKIESRNDFRKPEGVKRKDEEIEKESAAPEKAPESKIESGRQEKAPEAEERTGGPEMSGAAFGQSVQHKFKERQKQIEKILAHDLEDIFLGMAPPAQREFKKVGEQTTQEINTLLQKTKVRAKKIINLIKKWLALIPGVNKFFLEQESKIKADEILKLKMKK